MLDDLDPSLVGASLQASIGAFTRRLRQAPTDGELTFAELLALSRLDQLGPATAAQVARAEQVTPQAIGPTLAQLQHRGLVERHDDPRDRRRVLVSLTPEGARALHERRDARSEQIARALADRFTQDELRTLAAAAELIERLGREIC